MGDSRQIEISVRDKVAAHTEVFRCEVELVRRTMKYFEPLIDKQLSCDSGRDMVDSRTVMAARPLTLKVNCDVTIFRWLVNHMEGRAARLTPTHALSILLSSNFLKMHVVTEEALWYIHDHLVEVLLSGMDMDCVSGDLLGRLSAITRDVDIAKAMEELYDRQEDRHVNRAFLTALLRHLAMDCLSTRLAVTGDKNHKSKPLLVQSDGTSLNAESAATRSIEQEGGLRWCRLCGVLYDHVELQRLVRNYSAESGARSTSDCQALCAGASRRRVGPRGEVYGTHAPSTHPVNLALLPASKGGEAVELWAWRVLGATRYLSCSRCMRWMMLTEVPHHHCSPSLPCQFLSLEKGASRPLPSVSTSASAECAGLVRWYQRMSSEGLYATVGEVTPLQCPPEDAVSVAAESIVLSRVANTAAKDRAHPLASPCTWAAAPEAVSQVPTVGVGGSTLMDIDVRDYYERDFMQCMLNDLGACRTGPAANRQCPAAHQSQSPAAIPQQSAHPITLRTVSPNPTSSLMSLSSSAPIRLSPPRGSRTSAAGRCAPTLGSSTKASKLSVKVKSSNVTNASKCHSTSKTRGMTRMSDTLVHLYGKQ